MVLTGQWDHPAARDCEVVVTEPWALPEVTSVEQAVLACRSEFVITGIEPET